MALKAVYYIKYVDSCRFGNIQAKQNLKQNIDLYTTAQLSAGLVAQLVWVLHWHQRVHGVWFPFKPCFSFTTYYWNAWGKLATVKRSKVDGFSISPLSASLWRRANAQEISFQSLYSGQFTLSIQLIKLIQSVLFHFPTSAAPQFLETDPFVYYWEGRPHFLFQL